MQAYLDFFLRSTPNGPSENPLGLGEEGSQFAGQDQFVIPLDDLLDVIRELEEGLSDEHNDLLNRPPTTSCPYYVAYTC